jgi:prepilin signal peptidase PulO-like enzyme (type II secretory pathway)
MEFWIGFYAFIFGLLIGSFLNVVILRLPMGKDLVFTRSACPSCGAKLRWFDNIPLLSFIALKGKCGFCKGKISWRYPLIELITGLIAILLLPSHLVTSSLFNYLFYFSVACVFVCHIVIDLEHHLLLDKLNLYLLILFTFFALINYHWSYWVIGGAVGFGVPFLVTWLFYKIRGQIGLGGGDIKLFGILGIFLGAKGIMMTLFLSCLLGALVGIVLILLKKTSKDRPMAFGPAILATATIQIYFPDFAIKLQDIFLH